MRAVLLAGGFGTRLLPLTKSRPKQMLPVADKPMLEHIMVWLGSQVVPQAGQHVAPGDALPPAPATRLVDERLVDEVVLSLGFQPDSILGAYPDGVCGGMPFVCAVEPEPLDTAGALYFAAEHFGITGNLPPTNPDSSSSATFLAMNGDILCDLSCAEVLQFHRENNATATLVLTPVFDASRYGKVETDENGRVLGFLEKQTDSTSEAEVWINAGIYFMEPSALDGIPSERKVSLEREVFPRLVAQGELFAYKSRCGWLDAGTPETFRQAQFLPFLQDASSPATPASAPHARRSVASSANFSAPVSRLGQNTVRQSIVMKGASVAEGALVEESVLFPGCRIEKGATVLQSVIGEGAVVEQGASVSDNSMVGDNIVVPAGTKLVSARFPS